MFAHYCGPVLQEEVSRGSEKLVCRGGGRGVVLGANCVPCSKSNACKDSVGVGL